MQSCHRSRREFRSQAFDFGIGCGLGRLALVDGHHQPQHFVLQSGAPAAECFDLVLQVGQFFGVFDSAGVKPFFGAPGLVGHAGYLEHKVFMLSAPSLQVGFDLPGVSAGSD